MFKKYKLKNNKRPISITFLKKESIKLTAHNHIVVDVADLKLYIVSAFTGTLQKFNAKGYYEINKTIISKILTNEGLKQIK